MIVIPLNEEGQWDFKNAIAVELESSAELTTHTEQVNLNMLKNLKVFDSVDIRSCKDYFATLERIHMSLPSEKRERVTLSYAN